MMFHLEENYDTLADGMDGLLKNAATYFEFDDEEIDKEDYAFRYDANFPRFTTYELKASCIAMPIFLGYHFLYLSLILDVC